MTLQEQVRDAIKRMMMTPKVERTLTILRGLLAEIIFEEKKFNVGTVLTEEQVLGVILREKKKYEEALEFARQADREEHIVNNEHALTVLKMFLPTELTDEDVKQLIREVITQINATSAKDFGNVMKVLSPKIKGQYDGKKASELVKGLLS